MTTAKVYRNGTLTVPVHGQDALEAWSRFDATKPAGRAGRLESLYASPSLAGVVRWVRGNHMLNYRVQEMNLHNNEITVLDPENVYVYSIEVYERIVNRESMSTVAYWESGIRLSDWETVSVERGLDPRNWEVLLPVESIKVARPVSDKRILDATKDKWERAEVARMLKYYAKLIKWNKPAAA